MPSSPFDRVGGRKFVGFILTLGVVVLFVLNGNLDDQPLIRDLIIALPSIFGLLNVAQKSKLVQPATTPKAPE